MYHMGIAGCIIVDDLTILAASQVNTGHPVKAGLNLAQAYTVN